MYIVDNATIATAGLPGITHRTLAAFAATPVGVVLPDGTPIDLPWKS